MTTTLDVIEKCLGETPINFDLENKIVVVTGQSDQCSREDFTAILQKHGAKVAGGITQKTDYLIVGRGKSDGWLHEAYGKKLEKAIEIMEAGGAIQIVSDDTVFNYVASTKPPKFNSVMIFELLNTAHRENIFTEFELGLLHAIAANAKSRAPQLFD